MENPNKAFDKITKKIEDLTSPYPLVNGLSQ